MENSKVFQRVEIRVYRLVHPRKVPICYHILSVFLNETAMELLGPYSSNLQYCQIWPNEQRTLVRQEITQTWVSTTFIQTNRSTTLVWVPCVENWTLHPNHGKFIAPRRSFEQITAVSRATSFPGPSALPLWRQSELCHVTTMDFQDGGLAELRLREVVGTFIACQELFRP